MRRSISQYYQCTEDLTHIPFIDPVTVLACDHRGIQHTLGGHDITVKIPKNAIPIGQVAHIELAVTLHGPFMFPSNMRPISPILWLCTQEDITFNSPIQVTLPHFLTDLNQHEITQLGVTFAKANHKVYLESKESQVMFKFSSCSGQPKFTTKQGQGFGSLETRHCFFFV